jgi:formate C-acetyltransferase
MVGCVEPTATGKEYGNHDACYFSQTKIFELTINNGFAIDEDKSGTPTGIDTGNLADFKSFDELMNAYLTQQAYWVHKCVTFLNMGDLVHHRLKPLPWVSVIIDGCIDSGRDVTDGGAKYNFLGPNLVGPATVTDSLCAVKQLVFDEKVVTGAEMMEALKNDWKGYESLYKLINSDKVHHFGNDDPYADDIANIVVNSVVHEFEKYNDGTNTRNSEIIVGCLCGGGNIGVGLDTAATPDGRRAYEPVSNSINPCYNIGGSHDYNGPTAVLKSVGSLDSPRLGNGTLLNIKFNPKFVAGEAGRDNLIRYMESLVKLRVHHVQFNLQDKETLLAAQEHPEEYNSLLVRVAAYSAYFTRLSHRLQDEVIRRHEFDEL